jgi:hypothetical protein
MKKKSYYSYILLDSAAREKILAVMMLGNNKAQSIGFYRTALGLYYLSRIMVEDELDFKEIDKDFNRFIFNTIGRGHSITSILQYMSSKKVLWVLNSKAFLPAFLNYFSDIPFAKITLLLTINLSVSKKISGLATEGALQDWLLRQTGAAPQQQGEQDQREAGEGLTPHGNADWAD